MKTSVRRFMLLSAFAMVGVFVLSNVLVSIPINDWLTYGAFSFPLVFLITDLTNRAVGPQPARRLAWVVLPFTFIISAYFATPQIALASAVAFVSGQFLDIALFNRFRAYSWWLAPWLGSMAGSVVDTFFFFGIAFYNPADPQWLQSAFQLGVGDLSIKWLMACVLLAPYRALLPHINVWQALPRPSQISG